jgi:propionate CoA-transferase
MSIQPRCVALLIGFTGVSRYTTSSFLRMKLGEASEKRGVAPHIFESAPEAQTDFRSLG